MLHLRIWNVRCWGNREGQAQSFGYGHQLKLLKISGCGCRRADFQFAGSPNATPVPPKRSSNPDLSLISSPFSCQSAACIRGGSVTVGATAEGKKWAGLIWMGFQLRALLGGRWRDTDRKTERNRKR